MVLALLLLVLRLRGTAGAVTAASATATGAAFASLSFQARAQGKQPAGEKNADDDSICHSVAFVVLEVSLVRCSGWGAALG